MTLTAQPDLKNAMALLCPSWPADEIDVVQYLDGGYRNANHRLSYRGEHYVLRIAQAPKAPTAADVERFEAERDRLTALSTVFPSQVGPLMLDIAPVVAVHISSGLLLTRWCEQPLLAETSGVTAETLGAYLALLHLSLNRIPAPRLYPTAAKQPQPDLKAHILSDLSIACGSTAKAAALLTNVPLSGHQSITCHLDLNPWNLLTDGAIWLTLDWETLTKSDPMFDLVALCDGYLRAQDLSANQVTFGEAALAAYNSVGLACVGQNAASFTSHPYDAADLQRARTLFQLREYAWAAAQVIKGNARNEIILQRNYYGQLLSEQGFEISKLT